MNLWNGHAAKAIAAERGAADDKGIAIDNIPVGIVRGAGRGRIGCVLVELGRLVQVIAESGVNAQDVRRVASDHSAVTASGAQAAIAGGLSRVDADIVGKEIENRVAGSVGKSELGLVAVPEVCEFVVAVPAGGGVGAVGVINNGGALVVDDFHIAIGQNVRTERAHGDGRTIDGHRHILRGNHGGRIGPGLALIKQPVAVGVAAYIRRGEIVAGIAWCAVVVNNVDIADRRWAGIGYGVRISNELACGGVRDVGDLGNHRRRDSSDISLGDLGGEAGLEGPVER